MTRTELRNILIFFVSVLVTTTIVRYFFGLTGLAVMGGLWLIFTAIVLIRIRNKAVK